MMTTAGKLLATVSRYQDPSDPDNEFKEWLWLHLLSRQNGHWLADRRDPGAARVAELEGPGPGRKLAVVCRAFAL